MIITVWFCYPETRGHSLEQMAVLFDGEEAEMAVPKVTAERTASVVSELIDAEYRRKSIGKGEAHVEVVKGEAHVEVAESYKV
jgi:hypothetical protein